MEKTIKISIFALAIVVALGACASKEKQCVQDLPEEEQLPVISVDKAPDDISGDYHFFADEQTDERIILHITKSVENFAYIEIMPSVDDEDNFMLLAGEELFGIENFTPEKPFVVSASIGSTIPTRGIVFWHRGSASYFFITESGMDGSILLVEFNPPLSH